MLPLWIYSIWRFKLRKTSSRFAGKLQHLLLLDFVSVSNLLGKRMRLLGSRLVVVGSDSSLWLCGCYRSDSFGMILSLPENFMCSYCSWENSWYFGVLIQNFGERKLKCVLIWLVTFSDAFLTLTSSDPLQCNQCCL